MSAGNCSSVLGVADQVGNLMFHTQLYENSKEQYHGSLPETNLATDIYKHAQRNVLRSNHEQQPQELASHGKNL